MIFNDSENNKFTSENPNQYMALQMALGTGTGQVALDASPQTQQIVLTQRSQAPSTFFMPNSSIGATMSYMQPQYNYRQPLPPLKKMDTKPNTPTTIVTVKGRGEARNQLIKDLFLVTFGMIICGIPLAVTSTLYAQARASSWTTTTTASVTTVVLPSQCTSYTTNTDSTRNVAYGAGPAGDNTLAVGWYRFTGGAGTQLATTYVSRDTCGTYYGGSYNGTLPSTTGTTTYGTLCLNNNGYLCYALWSGSLIGVTNCNGYYVYYLSPIATTNNARYCTTS